MASDTNARQYRTLIQGTLMQTSAMSVGGSSTMQDLDNVCSRDGLGRLSIPGTSLAGALIESAARIAPDVIAGSGTVSDSFRITGKRRTPPGRSSRDSTGEEFCESVWRFRNSHPLPSDKIQMEWRQGVGIRQTTGASAAEKKALFDYEVVPVGTRWQFFLEIDTFHGGRMAEALAVLALNEWCCGRGWIGRSPARGTGWFDLKDVTVARLPLTSDAINAWPSNQDSEDKVLKDIKKSHSDWNAEWSQTLEDTADYLDEHPLTRGTWYYLTLDISLTPGKATGGYGYDVLQVSGHPAGELNPSQDRLLPPISLANPKQENTQNDQSGTNSTGRHGREYTPDAPFIRTRPTDRSDPQPFLPGGGLRGPLRHTASRLERGQGQSVRDPNDPKDKEKDEFLKKLTDNQNQIKSNGNGPSFLSDADVRKTADRVTALFGAEELCSRILVRDARLKGDAYTIALIEHHAEDEFTAGPYGSSKFNRDVLLKGKMQSRIIVEAPSLPDLWSLAGPLISALDLAQLGHVPVGGSKWRCAGWLPWSIDAIQIARAGDLNATATDMYRIRSECDGLATMDDDVKTEVSHA